MFAENGSTPKLKAKVAGPCNPNIISEVDLKYFTCKSTNFLVKKVFSFFSEDNIFFVIYLPWYKKQQTSNS